MTSLSESSSRHDELREWSRFIDEESYLLKEWPEMLFQQAANQPQSSSVRYAAESRLQSHAAGSQVRPWLQWLNRPESSACILTLTGHGDLIKQLAVTNDNQRLISIGSDNTLRVSKLDGGKELFKFNDFKGSLKALMPHMSWYRRAPWFMTEDRGQTRIWDSENGSLIAEVDEEITGLVFSDDAQFAAWETQDLQHEWYMDLPTAPFHDGWRKENIIKVRDWQSGGFIATLFGCGPLTFSPDGRYLVYGDRVYDLLARKEMGSILGGAHVAISPDSRLLVSAQKEISIFVYELQTGELLFVLDGHTHWIAAVAITPDGQRIITAGKHGDIKIWDAVESDDMETADGFVPDEHGGLRDVKFKKGKLLLDIDAHEGTVNSLSMLDNHRLLTAAVSDPAAMQAGQDFSIKVWDVETGEALGAVAAHGDRITAFAHTPDGRRIVTGDEAGVIRVWDVEILQGLKDPNTSFDSISQISITSDCAYVVTRHAQGSVVRQTLTGRVCTKLDPSSFPIDALRDGEFANGSWLTSWTKYESAVLEIVGKDTGLVTARFVFPEKIEMVAARGPFVAVGGSTFGKVYLLELKGVEIEPRFADIRHSGGKTTLCCPHCREEVEVFDLDPRRLLTCNSCQRKVQVIDYGH